MNQIRGFLFTEDQCSHCNLPVRITFGRTIFLMLSRVLTCLNMDETVIRKVFLWNLHPVEETGIGQV